MIVLLVFVLIAQVTTNLTINILPPALIFMDTFRMTWPQGVLLSGVLGVVSCPWLLMSNFNAFLGFILNYSALFGPDSRRDARRLLRDPEAPPRSGGAVRHERKQARSGTRAASTSRLRRRAGARD
jgi:hypothetical protein